MFVLVPDCADGAAFAAQCMLDGVRLPTDQAVLERPDCKLSPRPQPDLVENVRDVRLHGADRNDQPFGDFFVGETLRDQ